MPELNLGAKQGEVLPLYLIVKTVEGELAQPLSIPTIMITYIDPTTHVRKISVDTTLMNEVEPGRYFYVWRIAKEESCVIHTAMIRIAIEERDVVEATETLTVSISVIQGADICYPEVMSMAPRCRPHPHITRAHGKEVDIGLDDYALEGVFRFGEFPNQVVDRRVVGRYSYTYGTGTGVPSEMPGGGPAPRPGNPTSNYTRYRDRQSYRY